MFSGSITIETARRDEQNIDLLLESSLRLHTEPEQSCALAHWGGTGFLTAASRYGKRWMIAINRSSC
jgi:hypothetical protein